jgi:hypothetical protein
MAMRYRIASVAVRSPPPPGKLTLRQRDLSSTVSIHYIQIDIVIISE